MATRSTGHLGPELFAFLRALKRNNEREWFQQHKARYERAVKEPLQRFIGDFAPQLAKISPHFVADPRPVGGSMFRIYRDVRFSADKSPYKTAAAAHFRHEAGKDVHAPGFYLHLEPDSVFAGAGIWQPDASTARQIREAIVEDSAKWKRAVRSKAFTRAASLGGESLKRVPRGFDPDHPLVEDIKRKDFVAMIPFSEQDTCKPDFLQRYSAACKACAPFVRFLARATGCEF